MSKSLILKKNISGVECEVYFDDKVYSKEETTSLVCEFLYLLTKVEEK